MPPVRYDIEPGGEYLLPFAKKKLAELRAEAKNRKLRSLQKRIMVDSGSSISLSTQESFGETTNDSIRVTGGGWVAEETTTGVTTPKVYFLRSAVSTPNEANNRNLNPSDYYFRGNRYRIDVISSAVSGIPDPDPISGNPLVYPLLAIYNVTSKKYVKWVAFTLTGSDGTSYKVQYTDFTFVASNNIWAVAYLSRSVSTPWIRKVICIDISGNSFNIDFPALGLFNTANSITRLVQPSIAPVGVMNGLPYFFVDGSTTTQGFHGAYKAILVSSGATIEVLTLNWIGTSPDYDFSWYAGKDCGGAVTRPDGTQALEVIFQLSVNDLSNNIPTSTTVYGYATDTGIEVLDTASYNISTGGRIVIIPPNSNYFSFGVGPTSASAVRNNLPSLPDRKSSSCVAATRLTAPAYVFNSTLGSAQYGAISLDGYAPMVSYIDSSDTALGFSLTSFADTFTTNSFYGFMFSSPTGLRFVDTAGTLLLDAPSSTSGSFLGSSRRLRLFEKDDVVVFSETLQTLSNSVTRVVYRWMFRLSTGAATLLSTYQFTSSSTAFTRAILDGLVSGGKAYAYVLAEDTPNTTPKSTLRLITNSPGSAVTYLALMDSTGKIGSPIQSGVPNTFTLDATEPTLKATALQFAAWNK